MPVPAEMMPGHSVGAADSPGTENSHGHCDICASDSPWSPSRENKREGLILKAAACQPVFSGRCGICSTQSCMGCVPSYSLQ